MIKIEVYFVYSGLHVHLTRGHPYLPRYQKFAFAFANTCTCTHACTHTHGSLIMGLRLLRFLNHTNASNIECHEIGIRVVLAVFDHPYLKNGLDDVVKFIIKKIERPGGRLLHMTCCRVWVDTFSNLAIFSWASSCDWDIWNGHHGILSEGQRQWHHQIQLQHPVGVMIS